MKKLCLATTALAFICGSAMAADMPVKAVYKAPVVYAYSWTGCYVGGHGGGVWVSKDATLAAPGIPALPAIGGFPAFAGAPAGTSLGSHSASSWIGGVQVGCNYQFAGNWVIGLQADYGWADARGSHIDPLQTFLTDSSRTSSLGSVTGRVGYAWDRFLGYVKGGWAWERDTYQSYVTAAPATVFSTGGETRNGGTIGVGGEYAFTDWLTGFVEYDYYFFGTRTVTQTTLVGPVNVDIRDNKSVVKAGLNFKFGGSPVVARY
jgi:outer membrane immunogenic protein